MARILIAAALAVFASTALAQNAREVVLKNGEGKEVGKATLTQLANGVRIVMDVSGLSPGDHAFHIHENGSCQGPKFESAGGHYAPAKKSHGFDDPKGYHAGDMPNLRVEADGKAHVEVINTSVTLKPGKNSLLKKGGTSLVIHEKADDYKTQPSGDAGSRLVCGEIAGS